MKPSLFFVITMSFQFAQALTEIKTVPTAGRIQFEAVGRPSMIKIKGTIIQINPTTIIITKNTIHISNKTDNISI